MAAAHSKINSSPHTVKLAANGVVMHEKACDPKDKPPVVASYEVTTEKTPVKLAPEPVPAVCFRRHPTKPKTDWSPPHEEYRDNRPAWGPGEKSITRRHPWGRHHYIRVATMPESKPFPAYDYKYISILDEFPAPVEFCECDSCKDVLPSPSGLSRKLASLWHTYRARHGADLSIWRRWFTFYVGTQRHKGRIVYGIQPGEVECPVRGLDDWTTHWTWALAVRHQDATGKWKLDGRFYFNWMHLRLREGVPWRNAKSTEERETSGPLRVFSDTFKPPRWCATFNIVNGNGDVISDANPWDYLTPETVQLAQLVLRTGPGRYKRVMWYHRGIGYGNDIEGHEPAPCYDESTVAYASFVRPLIGI